jgi:AcrR family transcriptional regulator
MGTLSSAITQIGFIMSRWPSPEEMRARILESTDRLFYERGIRATGVDTVAGEVGISKRTLYDYYPSKDELIAAYLSHRLVDLEITDRPPREQVLSVFEALERRLGKKRFRGCPFVNAVAEVGDEVREANRLAVAFKERRRQWFRDLLERLGVGDADGLSMQLAILLDGAIATSLVRGDPAFVRAARDAAATLIDADGRG